MTPLDILRELLDEEGVDEQRKQVIMRRARSTSTVNGGLGDALSNIVQDRDLASKYRHKVAALLTSRTSSTEH